MVNDPTHSDSLAYRVAHKVFLAGLVLKGLNAFVELIIGGLLLAFPYQVVRDWTSSVATWVQHLSPSGWTHHFDRFVNSIAPSGVTFVAWYFLSHGVLKALIIVCLVLGKRWAYPLGIVVFTGFGVYQTWEYFHTGGIFYLILDGLDLGLIALTVMEWKHASRLALVTTPAGR